MTVDKALLRAIESLYTINLGVCQDESVLVFTDIPSKEEETEGRNRLLSLAKTVAEIGKGFADTTFLTYPSTKGHGVEPPAEVWRAAFGEAIYERLNSSSLLSRILTRKEEPSNGEIDEILGIDRSGVVDCIIALSYFSTSHTIFRDIITRAGARYASMPLFDEEMFYGPMMVDWKAMEERTIRLLRTVEGGERIEIEAPNGTEIEIHYRGRRVMADTGILTKPGSFGNLPAGEVFLAPLEGLTEGRLVLEWAPTFKLNSKVILGIRSGKVVEINGDDPYRDTLDSILSKNEDFKNIAELGIGTNDMAKRADNILESEKILGTIHIALGDNSSFGGSVRTPFHQDFIVFEPTVRVIDIGGKVTEILNRGLWVLPQ